MKPYFQHLYNFETCKKERKRKKNQKTNKLNPCLIVWIEHYGRIQVCLSARIRPAHVLQSVYRRKRVYAGTMRFGQLPEYARQLLVFLSARLPIWRPALSLRSSTWQSISITLTWIPSEILNSFSFSFSGQQRLLQQPLCVRMLSNG